MVTSIFRLYFQERNGIHWVPLTTSVWLRWACFPATKSLAEKAKISVAALHLFPQYKRDPSAFGVTNILLPSFTDNRRGRLSALIGCTGFDILRYAVLLKFCGAPENLACRRYRKWSLNRQFQCKNLKNYPAHSPKNLAHHTILQHFDKTSTASVISQNDTPYEVEAQLVKKINWTRMHSSRMRTARSLTISCSICHVRPPAIHTPLPHMPPAMHAPCHICPPATHTSTPCHACPPPHMPPLCHARPPATHAPHHV